MDQFDRAVAFHAEALSRNFCQHDPHKGEKAFIFDLNLLGFVTVSQPTPERIMKLLALAWHHEDFNYYGTHSALLAMVARRNELKLNKEHLYWHRPYLVAKNDDLVSLREWLKEQDYNPDWMLEDPE